MKSQTDCTCLYIYCSSICFVISGLSFVAILAAYQSWHIFNCWLQLPRWHISQEDGHLSLSAQIRENQYNFGYLSSLKMTTKSWVTSSKASSSTDWLLITRCRCSTHLSSSSYRCFKELFSTDGNLGYRLFCFMLYVVWSSSSYHRWKWLFWTEMELWITRCCCHTKRASGQTLYCLTETLEQKALTKV